ncbi:MAG TPA: cyclase family protein [Candidatus Binataceae bacterium]|jgi:kynurenine formamidase|nr:cyclase family protein [Candidatus Binataceae bacterium]
MAKIEWNRIPKFAQLPVKPEAPPQSSWGVFGDDDQLGCLNFLTAQGVIAAAGLVKKGSVFRLDAPIGFATPPPIREPVKHTIRNYFDVGFSALDDVLDNYNTQEGSQWDGYAHYGRMRDKLFYNGVKLEEIKSGLGGKLSIHQWKNKVVGRGVLIDVFRYCTEQGRQLNPLTDESYSTAELKAAAREYGVELKPGTILLVRTGWMQAYLKTTQEERRRDAPKRRSIGVERTSELMEWLWDNRIAAIASDCPGVEPTPIVGKGILHHRALFLLGLPLGEMFDLEELAEDCATDRVTEFMLVSAPLNLEGGIASPPNAVAIK